VLTLVPQCEPVECEPVPAARQVRTHCPDCSGELAVLRVIPGRAEYWTLRCEDCGGIHLDILDKPRM